MISQIACVLAERERVVCIESDWGQSVRECVYVSKRRETVGASVLAETAYVQRERQEGETETKT